MGTSISAASVMCLRYSPCWGVWAVAGLGWLVWGRGSFYLCFTNAGVTPNQHKRLLAMREHKILTSLFRQHRSPGTQQGSGWPWGLAENWQCDHGTAHWARTHHGQIKPFQTGFNLMFPNLRARTFQSHFFKFVFHLWLLLKHPPTWSYQLFPALLY